MSADPWIPTPDQLAWMRDELAEQFAHLSVSVEMREGTIYVEAVPQ